MRKRTHVFPYRDEFGRVVAEKQRFMDGDRKTFRPRHLVDDPLEATHGDSVRGFWKYGLTDEHDPLLYRLPQLLQAIGSGAQRIYWCEGERDADALVAADEAATSSLVIGDRGWAAQAAWFKRYTGTVMVCMDNDDAGAAQAVGRYRALRQLKVRTKVVRAAFGKDVRDHLEAGHPVDGLENVSFSELKGLAARYEPGSGGYESWSRGRLIEASSERQVPTAGTPVSGRRRLAKVLASDLVPKRVRYAWEGRMPLHAVTLFAGEEGIGKSLMETDLLAQLTRGELPGEFFGRPEPVYLLTPEDDYAAVVRPRLDAAGADVSKVHIVRGQFDGDDAEQRVGGITIPDDLPLLAEEMHADGARVLFCDAFVDQIPADADSHKYDHVTKVLHALNDWAQAEDFAVGALWHINKTSSNDSAVKLMGSRGFRTAVRSVVMIARDPDLEEGENGGIVVLDKANAGTLNVPGLRYRIDAWPYTVEEVNETTGEVLSAPASCGVLRWTGNVDGDARAVLRETWGVQTDAGSAKAWLQDYLTAAGPTWRSEVVANAKQAGFSEAKIKRAANALAVTSTTEPQERKGLPPLRTVRWSLPQRSGDRDA